MKRACGSRYQLTCIRSKYSHTKPFPEELLPFLSGRRRHERVDSVTETILRDRQDFRNTMDSFPIQRDIKSLLSKHGYSRRRKRDLKTGEKDFVQRGQAVHLSSASGNWPMFEHVLPEIAFAGHSNSGKSTLVNVLAGFDPRKGPAGVSDRAGWTDQICFYQLCKRPPVMVIADLPGYGHAIAEERAKREWQRMTKDYLGSRIVLSRCCILVDCSRGLCEDDITLLTYLSEAEVPWQIILTKTDLLTIDDLSKSIALTELELLDKLPIGVVQPLLWCKDEKVNEISLGKPRVMTHRLIIPLSARTGVGIDQFWHELLECCDETSVKFANPQKQPEPEPVRSSSKGPIQSGSNKNNKNTNTSQPVVDTRVREHLKANLLRKLSHQKPNL